MSWFGWYTLATFTFVGVLGYCWVKVNGGWRATLDQFIQRDKLIERSSREPFRARKLRCDQCRSRSWVEESDLFFPGKSWGDHYAQWRCADCGSRYNRVGITYWVYKRLDDEKWEDYRRKHPEFFKDAEDA